MGVVTVTEAAADLTAAWNRALYGFRATVQAAQPNGYQVAGHLADTLAELEAVDAAERALVLALVQAGIPATTVARRCGLAPATVQNWLTEADA